MFNLGGLNHLAANLGLELDYLMRVLDDFQESPGSLVRELKLWYPDPRKKPRKIIAMTKRFRVVQERIHQKLLRPKLSPFPGAHGAVKGLSPRSNAQAHSGNTYALLMDISSFFPSITCPMVNDLFLKNACTYEVARALTRLCTYRSHLSLGLVTSPILANAIFKKIDLRISAVCRKARLTYTRFVDDITISGKYRLDKSGILTTITSIIGDHGFQIATHKTNSGRLDNRSIGSQKEVAITGIRVKSGRLDISKEYARKLDAYLLDHLSLANDEAFCGPLLLRSELLGKIWHAISLNRGRKPELLSRFNQIDWQLVYSNAIKRNLCHFVKKITEAEAARPECAESLVELLGVRTQATVPSIGQYDENECPF